MTSNQTVRPKFSPQSTTAGRVSTLWCAQHVFDSTVYAQYTIPSSASAWVLRTLIAMVREHGGDTQNLVPTMPMTIAVENASLISDNISDHEQDWKELLETKVMTQVQGRKELLYFPKIPPTNPRGSAGELDELNGMSAGAGRRVRPPPICPG